MSEEEKIENLGKGALPQPPDSRDYRAEPIFGFPVIDWSKEFRLPEPPNEHQGTSLSCVAQAWSYLHWQLKRKDYTRRSLYSRIFLPQGGAYLRDGGKELKIRGQSTRDEAGDPSPQREDTMRHRLDIQPEWEMSDIEADYYSIGSNNMDLIAHAILHYGGAVFGVSGTNKGWANKTEPRPPILPGDGSVWGHAIYAMGYHIHNGIKCIIAKSSWCSGSHHEHHIKENYFNSFNTFDCWVLIGKNEMRMQIMQIAGEQTLVIKNLAGRYLEVATSPELYPTVKKVLGIPDGVQLPVVTRAEVDANLEGQAKAGLVLSSNQ